jgi:integrase
MGSITPYTTTKGKRYRVRYRKPDNAQTDKRGFTTKRDAELFLATVEVSKAKGEYLDPTRSRATVGELGPLYLANLTHLKPSSAEPLHIAWRLYVEPAWGARAIADIQHSDVQAWVAALTNGKAKTAHATTTGPKSATVVRRAYGLLAAVLDIAVKDRRISSNPARGVSLPRKGKKARAYLTHEQVERLAVESRAHATLVRLMAYTGLRWGEATALRVSTIDLVRRRLVVQENAVRINGGLSIGTPKTHEARSVAFPLFLVNELRPLVEGKARTALVFGDGTNHVRYPTNRDGWFNNACRRAQAIDPTMPRVTLHDLRHAAASLAVSAGANVKAVQRMLGHASAAMTLDTYADLFEEDLDGVAERLDAARLLTVVGNAWAESPIDRP